MSLVQKVDLYFEALEDYWRAFANMTPQQIWDFLFKRDPATGMTRYETTKYLEENQDMREQQDIEDAPVESRQTVRDRKRRRKQTQENVQGGIDTTQDDYAPLTPPEKARVIQNQDDMEQRNQLERQRNAALRKSNNRQNEVRSEPAPKPDVIQPAGDKVDWTARDQYEAIR